MDWSPDDRRLLVRQYISANESYFHLLDLEAGKTEALLPAEKEKAFYCAARWSWDGKGVYFTSDRQSEFQRLWYLELASGKLTALTNHIPWDIRDDGIFRRTVCCRRLPPTRTASASCTC